MPAELESERFAAFELSEMLVRLDRFAAFAESIAECSRLGQELDIAESKAWLVESHLEAGAFVQFDTQNRYC